METWGHLVCLNSCICASVFVCRLRVLFQRIFQSAMDCGQVNEYCDTDREKDSLTETGQNIRDEHYHEYISGNSASGERGLLLDLEAFR